MAVATIGVPSVNYSVQLHRHGSWQMLEDGLITPDIAIHFLWLLREKFGHDSVHLFLGTVLLTKGGRT